MQKYVAMLEDKVQWLAIALGVLFVLFMTWSYVLKAPAEVEVSGEKLGPGEIDEYAVTHAVNQFDTAVGNNEKIVLEVPKHVNRFKDQMAWKEAAPVMDFAITYASQPKDVPIPQVAPPPGTQPPPPGPGGNAPPPGPNVKVAALPEIPAPTPGDHRFGRSLVIPPAAQGAAAPAPVALQPGQIDPTAHDQDWVTQVFKVNLADIDKAFTNAQIPVGDLRKTLFLQVTLEREELDANGKPVEGSRQVIKGIDMPRQPGQAIPPYPPPGPAGRDAAVAYLQYAAADQPDIIQPLFFTTVPTKGDQWQKPGEQAATAQVFDPLTFKGDPTSLPADQKEAVLKARRDKYKADQDAKKSARPAATPRSTPAGGGRGGPGQEGGGPNYAPAPVPPPRPAGAPRPPIAPYGGRPPGGFRPIEGGDENSGMYGGQGMGGAAVNVPGLPVAGTDYPNQDFDPGDVLWKGKTVEVWAHDTTVESGKTYHYRIKYKIKNPLFGTNAGAKPELNNQFDLESKDGGPWASPVPIPQLVNFFVQSSKSPNSNTVRFEIFKWEKGSQTSESFSVGPGDQIGTVKTPVGGAAPVDFSTDWSVVDFRYDDRQHDTQILLVNNKDGKVVARSYQADLNDPLYIGLKAQMNQLKAVPAAGVAPAANAGPGGP